MTRLIDANALLKAMQQVLNKENPNHAHIFSVINNAPTIEADSGEAVGVIKSESRLEDGAELHYAYLFKHLPIGTKLFTSPPKREWVGLNEGDIALLKLKSFMQDGIDPVITLAKAIEDKLKEVNGYD